MYSGTHIQGDRWALNNSSGAILPTIENKQHFAFIVIGISPIGERNEGFACFAAPNWECEMIRMSQP